MALITLAMIVFIALLYHSGPDGLRSKPFDDIWNQVEPRILIALAFAPLPTLRPPPFPFQLPCQAPYHAPP